MTSTQSFKIAKILRKIPNITEQEAQEAVTDIDSIIDAKFQDKQEILATKLDIAAVKVDIANQETRLSDRINRASLRVIVVIVLVAFVQAILKYYGFL